MKHVVIGLLFFSFYAICFGQTTDSLSTTPDSLKQVEIIHADKLQFKEDTLTKESVRKLIGNVKLKQDSTLMFCDSALFFKEENKVKAFGNVHINQNDSVNAYSDQLDYDGNIKLAILIDNAHLTDGKMDLYSDKLYYNIKEDKGYYLDGGRLENDSSILTSKKAWFYNNTKDAFFNEDVVITDPDYRLNSDTMKYNTKSEIAYFYGPTQIYNEESTIDCFNGWYDTKQELASFGENTTITNEPQVLYADSLYYNRAIGYGQTFKWFNWWDEEMDAGMVGTEAEYFEENKKIIAYQRPILVHIMDGDSLFMRADTIVSEEDLETETKSFWGYRNSRMFKSDMQSVCDSLYFSFQDSVFRMYYEPIVWSDQTEMQGDSIRIYIKNEKVHRSVFMSNAIIESQSTGKLFDQMQADKIMGFFVESKLTKMLGEANCTSLYYGKQDDGSYLGGNHATCKNTWMYLDSANNVSKVTFIGQPKALFTPISQMSGNQFYLERFKWNYALRPKRKEDL